ncbi:hypothetical protein PISL3812_07240 [Talaromyces islandicus]|uniref:Zn(2)-C6 fungal-type domain-containing protein n=1 Tax=Talaromyces islandicus TaxID=28573 RepID=A0A0U1M3Q4_TALIS|nr:hypothetical protein PISL3812_07240 [Talaromyces islandicus]
MSEFNNTNMNISELETNPSVLAAVLDAINYPGPTLTIDPSLLQNTAPAIDCINNQGPEPTISPILFQNAPPAVDYTNNQGPGSDADSEDDAEYEVDHEYDPDGQHSPLYKSPNEMPTYQNGVQTTEVNDGTSAAVPVENGEPVVDDEDFAIWLSEHPKDLQTKINKKLRNIKDLEGKILRHKDEVNKKQAHYEKEHALKKKGQFELDKIIESRDNSKKQILNREEDLKKATTVLQSLQNDLAEAKANPHGVYERVRKPTGTRKSPKRKSNAFQAGDTDLYLDNTGGDDSLSENEEYIKAVQESNNKGLNAKIACRWCKLVKRACYTAQNEWRCKECIAAQRRCRYNDPLFPDYQLSKGYLSDLHEEFEDTKAELAEVKQASRYSVWSSNPLSGITGYGPRSPTLARQNYWRMTHGMEPDSGRPVEKKKRKFEVAKKKERKPEEVTLDTPSRKRKPNPENTPSTRSSKRRRSSGTSNSNQTPSRTHTEGEPIVYLIEDSGDEGGNNDTTTGKTHPLPQTHGVSVTQSQLEYSQKLKEQKKTLPLDNNQLPCWPASILPNGNLSGN